MNLPRGVIGAVLALGWGLSSHAGVLSSPIGAGPISSPTLVQIAVEWTVENSTAEHYASVDPYWTVSVSLVPTTPGGESAIVNIFGAHNCAPHAGELAPNPFALNHTFVTPPATGSAQFRLPHPIGDHSDLWIVALKAPLSPSADYRVEVVGFHGYSIPEPSQCPMLAGLGLIALSACRRRWKRGRDDQ